MSYHLRPVACCLNLRYAKPIIKSAPATESVAVTTTPIPIERLVAKVVKAAVEEATSNIIYYDLHINDGSAVIAISERPDLDR